jgi:hypothetical protein
MFRAGHHQVPALRRALSCWWRQIGDTVCRCAYESGMQVKGKLIPAENRGIISHWAAAQTLCRQAAQQRRGAADRGEYRKAAGVVASKLITGPVSMSAFGGNDVRL